MKTDASIGRRAAALSVLALAAAPVAALGADGIAITPAAPADGDGLAAAIAGPQRAAANRARDAARHPYETLRFFGLAPNQSVIEIAPGGGWYTEILAPYLNRSGRLIAAHYPADDANADTRASRARFEARVAAAPAIYGKVELGTIGADGGALSRMPAGGTVDRVLTFRNLHNWVEHGKLDETLASFFAALRPGGVLGIEDHRAVPGTSVAQAVATGYVPVALVVERARAAGFAWLGQSEVNANPRDTKDHADGVWALPPTLRGGARDRDRYVAIGESDRMTLSFLKPPA